MLTYHYTKWSFLISSLTLVIIHFTAGAKTCFHYTANSVPFPAFVLKKSIHVHVHSSSLLQLWESILYSHSEGGFVKPVDIISTSFQTHQYTKSAIATRFHWPSPPDSRHCHRLMLVHCTLKPPTPLHVTTHYFLCLTFS